MKEFKSVMVVDLFGGGYALQLDASLQQFGYSVDSCEQLGRLSQRLTSEKRYSLLLFPLLLTSVVKESSQHVSVVQVALEVIKRLRQDQVTATLPVLLLLMNPDKPLSPYLCLLEEAMRQGKVDIMPMPCEPKLLAIKCNHFIRLSRQVDGLSVLELPEELNSAIDRMDGLSRREVEILTLVGEGLSNKEISQSLTLSEHSVRTHIYHIFSKLGIKRRSQAVLLDVYRKFRASSM